MMPQILRLQTTGVRTPTLRAQDQNMTAKPWIDEEEFNPGYMQRSLHLMPKRGDREPWMFTTNYYLEKDQLPEVSLDEEALVYEKAKPISTRLSIEFLRP
jgi:hypothetical protein